MVITEKMYLYNDILLDNKTALGTISSLNLILIKTIFYFIIQNLLLKRAVSEFLCDSFAL